MALMEFDPDKVYQEICEAYTRVSGLVGMGLDANHNATAELCAGWADLDHWMRKGGRPPKAWDPLSKTS